MLGLVLIPPLERLAGELGFVNAADAAAAVQVVKKRALVLLREAAAETAESDEAQHDEYLHVLSMLT